MEVFTTIWDANWYNMRNTQDVVIISQEIK